MKRYTSFMAFHVTQVKYVDFLALFNLTYCCSTSVCQSSTIMFYFKRYVSSQLRGFHLVLFQKMNEIKKDERKKDLENESNEKNMEKN